MNNETTELPSVSYLGPAGTFTEDATIQHFGESAKFVECLTIDQIFATVASKQVEWGVVPIENSIEGGVRPTLGGFIKYERDVFIVHELVLPIQLHLLSQISDISKIKVVYAHQQALAQARNWLQRNMSTTILSETNSNAAAVQKLSSEANSAAIASKRAASIYGIKIIHSDIQNTESNMTRFFVIGSKQAQADADVNSKTSLILITKHEAGALAAILTPLADNSVNMTHLESVPIHNRSWQYSFFIDVEGSIADPKVRAALAAVKRQCSYFRLLGSYPQGTTRKD